MTRKIKLILLVVLLLGQSLIYLNYPILKISVDLFFLIIFYVSIRMGFLRGIVTATVLGLVTDYFSTGVMGVFSFSRILACYFLTEVSRFLDLRKSVFVFLLILFTLFASNSVATLFFYFIFRFHVSQQLLLTQPLLTSLAGTLILALPVVKKNLNVY